ncbi:hypothetical protein HK104_007523 [Borealophlyctis nickersoniae]|nr:hypothetical protein HK104_007523 [Borealophlyctis nickersoniae]
MYAWSRLCTSAKSRPLYRSVSDLLFALVHSLDHAYILYGKVYPSKHAGIAMGFFVTTFLGYQIMITTVLALQTFSKVFYNFETQLGVYEYRLHVFALVPSATIMGVAAGFKAVGPNLYFEAHSLEAGALGGMLGWFLVGIVATATFLIIVSSTVTLHQVNKAFSEVANHSSYEKKANARLRFGVSLG